MPNKARHSAAVSRFNCATIAHIKRKNRYIYFKIISNFLKSISKQLVPSRIEEIPNTVFRTWSKEFWLDNLM